MINFEKLFSDPEQEIHVTWRIKSNGQTTANGVWHECVCSPMPAKKISHPIGLAEQGPVSDQIRQYQQRGQSCLIEFQLKAGDYEAIIATAEDIDAVFRRCRNGRGEIPTVPSRLKRYMATASKP